MEIALLQNVWLPEGLNLIKLLVSHRLDCKNVARTIDCVDGQGKRRWERSQSRSVRL